ncbi:MAG: eukaryotic-like serine/threonine-protein kinase, partial [Candidatus Binatota bacterium]|nr:eukaryotic-like serine/threonine-protein kinase [Candidatus Binatota bacterium]
MKPVDAGQPESNGGDDFVGRHREVELLRASLERARTARGGGMVLLAGEAGIGKTRLARKIAKEAVAGGMAVVWGRCWEGGGAPNYWPWVEVMREYVARTDDETLGRELGEGAPYVAELLPEIRSRLPRPGEPAAGAAIGHEHADPDHARFLLFDAVTRLLIAAARRRPLAIVVDDLHAADLPSLFLLEFVSGRLDDAPLLIIGTYREAEVRRTPEAADVVSRIARRSLRIVLRGLSQPDVAELVAATAHETVPPDVVREIHRVTDGSPLFVQEVVRTLAAEGRLSSPGARVRALPAGVHDVIRRRLAPLPAHCHDVLSVAAVVGREFDVSILEMVCDRPRAQIFEILDESIREGVIEVDARSRSAGRFRFSHSLFRETLYDNLQHGRRLGLHLQVARAMEKSPDWSATPRFSELAHHYVEAAPLGGVDEAVEYSLRAADAAARQLAYEEARAQCERALALPIPDERKRAEVLAELAEAQRSLGRWEDALPTWEQAIAIHERTGNREAVGRLCWDVGHQLGTAWRWPESFAFVGRGLAALGDIVNADHVRLLTRSGVALSAIGHHDAGKEAIDRALSMAETLRDEPLIGYAEYSQTIHHWCYLQVRQTIDVGRRAAARLRRSGDLEHAGNASTMVLGSELLAGRLKDAKRTAAELRPLAGKLAQHLSPWLMQAIDSAVVAVEGGDLAAAGRDLLDSVESAPRFEGDTYLATVLYGILASWRGDTEAALRQFEQVSRFDEDTAVTDSKSYVLLTLALAGRTDEALTLLDEWRSRIARAGQPNTYASWKLLLSATEVFVAAGKRDRAAELYSDVLEAGKDGARCVGIDLR